MFAGSLEPLPFPGRCLPELVPGLSAARLAPRTPSARPGRRAGRLRVQRTRRCPAQGLGGQAGQGRADWRELAAARCCPPGARERLSGAQLRGPGTVGLGGAREGLAGSGGR